MKAGHLAALLAAACLLAAFAAPAPVAAASDATQVSESQWLRLNSFPATAVLHGAQADAWTARFAEERASGAGDDDDSSGDEESSDESSTDLSSDESSDESESGDDEDEESSEESSTVLKKPKVGYNFTHSVYHKGRNSVMIPATKAVLNTDRSGRKRAADAGDAIDGASVAGIARVRRECPRHVCSKNSTCPIKGGICCGGSSHCCPPGATCLNTNPPTCVHDTESEPNRCAEEECHGDYHCPHDDVATCCLGGTVCCPKEFKCRATNPPTCEKILSPAERAAHVAMEARLLADKKAALADAITQQHARNRAELQKKIDSHTNELKLGEGRFKKNQRLAKTAHTERERANAKAAADRYQSMVSEDRTKKAAVSDDRKQLQADAREEQKEKSRDVERKIAEHQKRVGHLDKAESNRKRTDGRRLAAAAQERKAKEDATKKEQRAKEAKTKEQKRKAKAAEVATKKVAEQAIKIKKNEASHKLRARREGAGKRAATVAARRRAANEARGKEQKRKTHSRNKAVESRGKEQQKKSIARRKASVQARQKALSRRSTGEQRGKEGQNKRIARAKSQEQGIKRRNAPFNLVRGSRLAAARRNFRRWDLGGRVDYIKSVTTARNHMRNGVRVSLVSQAGSRRRQYYNHCVSKSRCVRSGGTRRTCISTHVSRVCTGRRAGGCAAWRTGRCIRYGWNRRCSNRCTRRPVRYWRNRGRRRIRTCRRYRRRWRWRTRYVTRCHYRWVGGGRYLATRWVRRCSRSCRNVSRRCLHYVGRRCVRRRSASCYRWAHRRRCVRYRTRHLGCAQYRAYRSCSRRFRWVGGSGAATRTVTLGGGPPKTWNLGSVRGYRYVDVTSLDGSTPPAISVLGRRL